MDFINNEINIIAKITNKNLIKGIFTNNKTRVNNRMMIREENIVIFRLNLKFSKEEKKRIYK